LERPVTACYALSRFAKVDVEGSNPAEGDSMLDGVRAYHPKGMELTAHDVGALATTLSCLLRDDRLTDNIPEPEEWTRSSDGPSGELKTVSLRKLPKTLRRFATTLAPLERNHAFVAATMTENPGYTNTVLIVVSKEARPRVAAIFVDEFFDHEESHR
jgi:hypothetical protein